MAYNFHTICFKEYFPGIQDIAGEIERITDQKILIINNNKNRYLLYFEFDREDRIGLEIDSYQYVINGDTGMNPALYQACRSALVNLGGVDTLKSATPIVLKTKEEICRFNILERKKLDKNIRWIWFYTLFPIVFVFTTMVIFGLIICNV